MDNEAIKQNPDSEMILLHTNLFLRFLRILTVHEEGPVWEKLVRTLFDYHTSTCNNYVKQKT